MLVFFRERKGIILVIDIVWRRYLGKDKGASASFIREEKANYFLFRRERTFSILR